MKLLSNTPENAKIIANIKNKKQQKRILQKRKSSNYLLISLLITTLFCISILL